MTNFGGETEDLERALREIDDLNYNPGAIDKLKRDMWAALKDNEELGYQLAELKAEIEFLKQDRARLGYLYSGTRTQSRALIDAELTLLNGGSLSLNGIREAIDHAMANPFSRLED